MCRLRNIAMHDYQESVTTGQTDRHRQTDAGRYASQATQKYCHKEHILQVWMLYHQYFRSHNADLRLFDSLGVQTNEWAPRLLQKCERDWTWHHTSWAWYMWHYLPNTWSYTTVRHRPHPCYYTGHMTKQTTCTPRQHTSLTSVHVTPSPEYPVVHGKQA